MATKKAELSTKDLQKGFGVGHMTVYNWRQGSATRDPLPANVDEKTKRVTFNKTDVKAWAKKYGLTFTEPTEKAAEVKPGPKPKTDGKKEPKPATKQAKAPVKAKSVDKVTSKSVAKRVAAQAGQAAAHA